MIRHALLCAATSLLLVSQPAKAWVGPNWYNFSLKVVKAKCTIGVPPITITIDCDVAIPDPVATDLTYIEWSGSFDTNIWEMSAEPLFFGDFGASGQYITVSPGVPGGPTPIPDAGFIVDDFKDPRAGSILDVNVDNLAGTFSIKMNLSANPIPGDAPPQSFMGVLLYPKHGVSYSVEYFSDPGVGQFNQNPGVCAVGGVTGQCGSPDGVSGFSIQSIPEPSTWALMLIGFGAAGGAMRRRRTNVRVLFG